MDMMEQQELEAQEAIMPEGYGEGDDYFQEEDWGKGDKVEADAEPEEQPHEKEEKTERDLRIVFLKAYKSKNKYSFFSARYLFLRVPRCCF